MGLLSPVIKISIYMKPSSLKQAISKCKMRLLKLPLFRPNADLGISCWTIAAAAEENL